MCLMPPGQFEPLYWWECNCIHFISLAMPCTELSLILKTTSKWMDSFHLQDPCYQLQTGCGWLQKSCKHQKMINFWCSISCSRPFWDSKLLRLVTKLSRSEYSQWTCPFWGIPRLLLLDSVLLKWSLDFYSFGHSSAIELTAFRDFF